MDVCPECGVENKYEAIRCHNCGYYFIDLNHISQEDFINIADQIGIKHFNEKGISFNFPENYLLSPPDASDDCIAALVNEKGICDIIIEADDLNIQYMEGLFEQNYSDYMVDLGYSDVTIISGFDYGECCFQALLNTYLGVVKSLVYFNFNNDFDIRITVNSLNKLNYNSLPDLKVITDTLQCIKVMHIADDFISGLSQEDRKDICEDMINDGLVKNCYFEGNDFCYEKNTDGEYIHDETINNTVVMYLLRRNKGSLPESRVIGHSTTTLDVSEFLTPDDDSLENEDLSIFNDVEEYVRNVKYISDVFNDSTGLSDDTKNEICQELMDEGIVKHCFYDGSDFYYVGIEKGQFILRENLVERINKKTNSNIQYSKDNAQLEDNKKEGCYIATCVYGSYDCPEVWTLRRYRDNILKEYILGKLFIKTYYATSPIIVKYFGNKKWFNGMFNFILDRFIKKLRDNGVDSSYYDGV